MASATFSDFFQSVDSVLHNVFTTAAAGMSNYILPVGWVMFGISALVWSLLLMQGKIESPVQDWFWKGFVCVLILYANLSAFLWARRLNNRLSTRLRESLAEQDSKLVHR
jgi:hypothetical protein